ncbi:MAG: 4-alpha-glucanotransferase [Alloprevotella sp.]
MNLTFRIAYRTVWGEALAVEFDGDTSQPILLSTADGEHWEGGLALKDTDEGRPVTYRYAVYRDGRLVRREGGRMPHFFRAARPADASYVLNDAWRDLPLASYLFSSAFGGNYPAPERVGVPEGKSTLTLRVLCPCLRERNCRLALLGQGEALGDWEPERALLPEEVMPGLWVLTVSVDKLADAGDYKFAALRADSFDVVEWEGGDNRHFYVPALPDGLHYFLPEQELYFPSTGRKVAGTAVPVFSLRSEGAQGVGDFGDLRLMVDWVAATKQKALQILPINDTTNTNSWQDSYPYNSISIYAFHPMYIDLRQVGVLADNDLQEAYERKRRSLNALAQVDYEAVNAMKHDYLRHKFSEEGRKVLQSDAYREFLGRNEKWLLPYAAFSALRDRYGTPVFSEWPQYSVYRPEEVAALCAPGSPVWEETGYYCYLQYLLHVQLKAVSDYARAKGVILKGDIPIGISRASVEAWTEPHYFNMNGQAGAPPDAFSANGQNWGFPTYNWERMSEDGYLWWKQRFTKMAEYFTAYRIDHILGFFRIWEIPENAVYGLLGQFSPALPMSPDEIGGFGLHFQKEFMTRPFINDELIDRLFGVKGDYARSHFLRHEHHDIYSLQPDFDTQRKIQAAGLPEELAEPLYALVSNVLFVSDRKNPELYHPRIAVQSDYIFSRLSGEEKEAFNRLYNHYFYERHNRFWYDEAMKKLPELLRAAPMLACGEDLGMVPDCVPWVMNELQIMSLEIERMSKNPRHTFGHVGEYPFRSVCTISTHDMSTFRGWWREDAEATARYYYDVLHRQGPVPADASADICEQVVRTHLHAPSLLCILALQDWLGIDAAVRLPDPDAERINIPANPRHYWRYRMHLTIESLMEENVLNGKIRDLVSGSGRSSD